MTEPNPRANLDYRLLDHRDFFASRLARAPYKPKGSSAAAKSGLRYENRVGKELQRYVDKGHFAKLEHNPWFTFTDRYGTGACSPDYILWTNDGEVIIVEVKLTWVSVAAMKLLDLYYPVVSEALDVDMVQPLVIVRNLSFAAPPAKHTLREAISSPYGLLQWPDNGHIIW